MKGWLLFFVVFMVVGGFLWGVEPRFYISTDRIFSPGEEAYVTLECRALDFVDIRVYRVDDPAGFFLGQSDMHQPYELNELSGVNPLEIITRVVQRDKQSLRDFLRRFVRAPLRGNIHTVHKGLKDVAVPSGNVGEHTQVKLLPGYTLIRQFRHHFSGDFSAWKYEKIGIFENAPGVYLVEGVNGKHTGYTLAMVSRLGVITKQSGKRLLCYTVNKISGEPIGGANLTIIENSTKKTLGKGKSDKNGIFQLSLENAPGLTVIAGKAKDYAIIDPVYFPVSVDHRKVYIYTDRPVYRPGQEVFFKGIVRDMENEEYKTAMDERIKVRIYGPKGSKITGMELKSNELGTFNGSFLLGEKPPVGTYKIVARVKDRDHQAEFKIKSYTKPRFRVDVDLDGSGLNGATVKGTVTAAYYFGTPVKEASINYYVYRTRFYVPWWVDEDYGWYYSESEYRSARQELVTEGNGKLDKDGKFYFQFETSKEDKDYTYRVEARVKDAGQFMVSGDSAIKTSRGQFHLGLRTSKLIYRRGDNVTVSFYTHDLNHRPVPAGFGFKAILIEPSALGVDGKITVKETVIYSKQLETGKKGRVSATFKLKKKGHIKLVARGVDKFDNIIRGSTSIWSARVGDKFGYGGEGIEIVTDRLSYRSGDTARFLVLSRFPRIPFLFTVEGGDLYSYHVHRFSGNACLIETKLEPRFSPNVYVQASTIVGDRFYQKRKTVIIPPVDKLLTVKIGTDKKIYKPGDTVTVNVAVTDYKKRAVQVELSLGVVDEAIYAISPELTVAMQKFFYPRKRNNVRTHNSLTFNFYGYSREVKEELARLEMRPESGLASFKGRARSTRRTFKDTCFWTPTVMTDKEGKARFSFNLPGNITQWRLTARCVNYFTQVGGGTHKIVSRKNLSIVMYPPLTFTQRDRLVMPVLVKNFSRNPLSGQFDFRIKGGKIGDFGNTFNIGSMGTAEFHIPLEIAGTDVGDGKTGVVLQASANAGASNDALEMTVPVTPYGVRKILNAGDIMAPGDKKQIIDFVVPENAYKAFHRGYIYVHNSIYNALLKSLNYLNQYPYGCVEQTMSGFLPNIVLTRILKKQNIDNLLLEKKSRENIRTGIAKLLEMQAPDGSWGWFSGNDDNSQNPPDGFMTAYVMYGLTEAKLTENHVDNVAYKKGLDAVEMLLKQDLPLDVRVLCLYVLARADRAPLSIIMALYRERESMSSYSLAQLALALWESGKTAEAGVCCDGLLKRKAEADGNTAYWVGKVRYFQMENDLPVDTTAMVLRALLKTHPQRPECGKAAYWLLNRRADDRWESTRDTAAAVIALSEFLGETGIRENRNQTVRLRVNDHSWRKVPSEVLFSDSGNAFIEIPKSELKIGRNLVEIEKTGGQELFSNIVCSYFSEEEETETQSGPLTVSRQYFRLRQGESRLDAVPVEAGENGKLTFVSGEEFLVKLTVNNRRLSEFMVLEDFLPAGFQVIENVRGYLMADENINNRLKYLKISHREARDDRMAFFFDKLESGEFTVYYLMRAALTGDYEVNPAVIRSMYFDSRRALSKRSKVTVKPVENR